MACKAANSWEDSNIRESSIDAIQAVFGHLGPRGQNARHDCCEMLFMAFAAMLRGAKNCADIWRFAQEKEEMLRGAFWGIPSHDTFSALFRKLNPAAFAEAFAGFMRRVAAAAGCNRRIALDGKAMRGTFEEGRQFAPRMMVSARGTELRVTLAAVPAGGGMLRLYRSIATMGRSAPLPPVRNQPSRVKAAELAHRSQLKKLSERLEHLALHGARAGGR
jgi:hypothetical protein